MDRPRMNPLTLMARQQHGFTFVEMAVVLALVGLMAWAVSTAYGNSAALRDRDRAVQVGESLRQALRAFALVNARLPCPDTAGSGWEGNAAGNCAAGDQAGGFPYRSLGMDLPSANFRAAYAVYRRASATPALDADLAVRLERTGDSLGDPHYRDARDLIVALNNAAGDALSASRTRLTGDDGPEGAIDCTANIRSHPAFLVVLPLDSKDGTGHLFETPHGSGIACAWAPGTGMTQARDDVVMAEPLTSLAGWLGARTP